VKVAVDVVAIDASFKRPSDELKGQSKGQLTVNKGLTQ